MTDFTRDCLRFCVRVGTDRPETFNIASRDNPDANIASLAAFAIALLDRAEKAEAERDRLNDLLRRIEGLDEKADAISWEQQAEDRGNLALQIAAERDRLREELREAEEAIRLIERITVTYDDARSDGDPERVARVGQDFLDHAAVRRALERAK